jgi:hypothetical protein
MKADLKHALSQLDGKNNDHWTSDGQPRLDIVTKLAKRTITREEVTGDASAFNRKNLTLDPVSPSGVQEGDAGKNEGTVSAATSNADTASADTGSELENSNAALSLALKRQQAASVANDAVISATALPTQAEKSNDIKLFQKSQAAQRAAAHETTVAMTEFLKSRKNVI